MKKCLKKGFTIVELVIVIAVIAILAAVLIPTFSNVIDKANESAQMQEVKNALTNYMSNIADSGKTIKAGLVFCYDEDHNASTLNDRTYYAYVNQGLQKIDSASITAATNIQNTSSNAITKIEYGAASSTDATAVPSTGAKAVALNQCFCYTVTVNNTVWYGITLDTGVQGYGSAGSTKTENDNIFVCTGFIATAIVEAETTAVNAASGWQAKAAALLGLKTLENSQFKITWAE